jgi:hypothetical protein
MYDSDFEEIVGKADFLEMEAPPGAQELTVSSKEAQKP